MLSILSRRPVQIDRIRPDEDQPGLRPSEVSFLRLLEKITEGTRVEISYTGTSVLFHPGTIAGGTFTHTCPVAPGERSVGWYLEPMLALAPFGKKDLVLTLKGITTDGRDASVDTIRTSGLPHLAMFLDKEGVELRVSLARRWCARGGHRGSRRSLNPTPDHKTWTPAARRRRSHILVPVSQGHQERLRFHERRSSEQDSRYRVRSQPIVARFIMI